MLTKLDIATPADDEALIEKFKQAEAAFERARKSLEEGTQNPETRRYLNTLLTNIIVSEVTMCW